MSVIKLLFLHFRTTFCDAGVGPHHPHLVYNQEHHWKETQKQEGRMYTFPFTTSSSFYGSQFLHCHFCNTTPTGTIGLKWQLITICGVFWGLFLKIPVEPASRPFKPISTCQLIQPSQMSVHSPCDLSLN